MEARKQGISLNQFVERALEVACSSKTEHHTHLTVNVARAGETESFTGWTSQATSQVQWGGSSASH